MKLTKQILQKLIKEEYSKFIGESTIIKKTPKQQKMFDDLIKFYKKEYFEYLDENGLKNSKDSGEEWEEETFADDYYYEPLQKYVDSFGSKLNEKSIADEVWEAMDKIYGNQLTSTSNKQIKTSTNTLVFDEELRYHSLNGDLDGVKKSIENGADVNCKNKDGWAPLHYSSYYGYLNIVKYLISKGADVNCKNKDGWAPLHYSSENGYLDIVKYLIDHGADVNCKSNNGWTPLHLSSHTGDLDIVRYLISKGADINCKSKYGNTPLHRSSYWNNLNVVTYLISKGADWNIKNIKNEYFIDLLSDKNKEIIIKKYPKQYEKFLANKK